MGHPRRALDAYVDGELAGARRRRVASHLGRCSRCQCVVATTVRVRASLRAMAGRLPA